MKYRHFLSLTIITFLVVLILGCPGPSGPSGHDGAGETEGEMVTEAEGEGEGEGESGIYPKSGQPGMSVTIYGTGFDSSNPELNMVYFGDVGIPIIGVSEGVLTTTVPRIDAGNVNVRVEASETVVMTDMAFEILDPPVLTEDPGVVAADMQNDIASIVADTNSLMETLSETFQPEDAEQVDGVFEIIGMQLDALSAIMDDSPEEGKQAFDEMVISSGLADALGDLQKDLKMQMAKIAEIKALNKQYLLKLGGAPGVPESAIVPQMRFTLDWTAGRLHHAMEYANVAMLGLSAAGAVGGGPMMAAVGMAGMFAGILNNIYTIIEVSPMQLKKDTLYGTVGETGNAIATNSGAYVIFYGTFEPESGLEGAILGAFLPGFVNQLGIGPVLSALLNKLAGELMKKVGAEYDVKPMFEQADVPIFTYDFVGDPPTQKNPPQFDGGIFATLDVKTSTVQTNASEHEGIPLTATQDVYEFKGDFWDPEDRPRVETRTEEATVMVKILQGLSITLNTPDKENGSDDVIDLNQETLVVSGSVTNWDGSAISEEQLEDITITVFSAGESIDITLTDGEFSREVNLASGESRVIVTANNGETTATAELRVMNFALPTTYAVVTNVSSDSLSIVDPITNTSQLTLTLEGFLDSPRDAVFLSESERLIILNSPGEAFLSAIQMSSLDNYSSVGSTLSIGEGTSWSLAITPDEQTLLVPLRETDGDGVITTSQLFAVDARQPLALRIADTIDIIPEDLSDDYGPRDVAVGTSQDGRNVALITTGFYQDGGPSDVVLVDVTNAYDLKMIGSVSVDSRGGEIAIVPGRSLAIVAGPSNYDDVTPSLDSAINIIDFSDPDNPVVGQEPDGSRLGSYIFGVAVTPDGSTALISDVGSPLSPVNNMIFLDISSSGELSEITDISPMWFEGIGSPRIAVSPDGDYAVVASNVSDAVVVIDLSDISEPVPNDAITVGDLPFGVVFRP